MSTPSITICIARTGRHNKTRLPGARIRPLRAQASGSYAGTCSVA
jgi:hypothetical protein